MITCVVIIAIACLVAQQAHYHELFVRREHKDNVALSQILEDKIKEFDEYKSQVDTLVSQAGLRAGFKIK